MNSFEDDGTGTTPAELFFNYLDQRGDGLDPRLHAAVLTPGRMAGPVCPPEAFADNVIKVDFTGRRTSARSQRTSADGSGGT